MTSSPDTPEEVRPLTQEELAVQCAHDGLGLITEGLAKLLAAWPSLSFQMRHDLAHAYRQIGAGERRIACVLAAGGPSDD